MALVPRRYRFLLRIAAVDIACVRLQYLNVEEEELLGRAGQKFKPAAVPNEGSAI
jgi:hypothetical protein